jgi:hypothetical protein
MANVDGCVRALTQRNASRSSGSTSDVDFSKECPICNVLQLCGYPRLRQSCKDPETDAAQRLQRRLHRGTHSGPGATARFRAGLGIGISHARGTTASTAPPVRRLNASGRAAPPRRRARYCQQQSSTRRFEKLGPGPRSSARECSRAIRAGKTRGSGAAFGRRRRPVGRRRSKGSSTLRNREPRRPSLAHG